MQITGFVLGLRQVNAFFAIQKLLDETRFALNADQHLKQKPSLVHHKRSKKSTPRLKNELHQ